MFPNNPINLSARLFLETIGTPLQPTIGQRSANGRPTAHGVVILVHANCELLLCQGHPKVIPRSSQGQPKVSLRSAQGRPKVITDLRHYMLVGLVRLGEAWLVGQLLHNRLLATVATRGNDISFLCFLIDPILILDSPT